MSVSGRRNSTSMQVALDFDKTFTLAPKIWVKFIKMMEKAGHTVTIITARDQVNDGIDWATVGLEEPPCHVIWCDGLPKKDVANAMGLVIDIWIDDDPKGIFSGTTLANRDDLKLWRLGDKHRDAAIEPHGDSRGFEYKEAHQYE